MKKSILALAALSAFSGAAMALNVSLRYRDYFISSLENHLTKTVSNKSKFLIRICDDLTLNYAG